MNTTDWVSDRKEHNDIQDLSVFQSKFVDDKIFSLNKYTGEYDPVEKRTGVYYDNEITNEYKLVNVISDKYKIVNHIELFEQVNEDILKNGGLSFDNVEVIDTAYEDFRKVHRQVRFLDHEIVLEGTGREDDKLCLCYDQFNSTDSSWRFQTFIGAYRSVCQNTQVFGGERFFHIRKKHTSGFSVKEESRKITNSLEDFGTATEDFRAMIKAQVSEEWILDFFKKTVAYKEVSEALKKKKFKEMKDAVDRDAELEKLTVNYKLLGGLLARWEDEVNNGMDKNSLYTVYNALTNWSSHVGSIGQGSNLDSYENEKGNIIQLTNKGSKDHVTATRRQSDVIKAINSDLFQSQLQLVA